MSITFEVFKIPLWVRLNEPCRIYTGMMNSCNYELGNVMHCMIGIIFAAVYVYLFNPKVHIQSKFAKGALYGFVVFVFAQVMMFIIGKIMPMPMSGDNMMLMMVGSLIGHLVFGIVVALIVPAYVIASSKNNFRNAQA